MRWTFLAVLSLAGLAGTLPQLAQSQAVPPSAPSQPTVTLSAKADLLSDVLAQVREQTHVAVTADAFANQRRVTVDLDAQPLTQALDALAVAAVSAWDPAYILVPTDASFGPQTTPAGWTRPPQAPLALSGGSGGIDSITRTLTNMSAAAVGYLPELGERRVSTLPAPGASLEDVLSQLQAPGITWTRGYWLASIDRAAVFRRFSVLPAEQREALVLQHAEQMLRFDPEGVRQALMARHREFSALGPDERVNEIERYAEEIRQGIAVLNTLSPEVRSKTRDAMRVFLDQGLIVYRDLTEEEQIEATPIIEAMGELKR